MRLHRFVQTLPPPLPDIVLLTQSVCSARFGFWQCRILLLDLCKQTTIEMDTCYHFYTLTTMSQFRPFETQYLRSGWRGLSPQLLHHNQSRWLLSRSKCPPHPGRKSVKFVTNILTNIMTNILSRSKCPPRPVRNVVTKSKTKTKIGKPTCSSGPPKSPPHSVVVNVLQASNKSNFQFCLFRRTSFSDQLQCLTYLQILPDCPQSSTSATSFSPNSSFRYPDKKYLWWYHLFPDIAKIDNAVQCHSLWSGCYPVTLLWREKVTQDKYQKIKSSHLTAHWFSTQLAWLCLSAVSPAEKLFWSTYRPVH